MNLGKFNPDMIRTYFKLGCIETNKRIYIENLEIRNIFPLLPNNNTSFSLSKKRIWHLFFNPILNDYVLNKFHLTKVPEYDTVRVYEKK